MTYVSIDIEDISRFSFDLRDALPTLTAEEWQDIHEQVGRHLADRLPTVHEAEEYVGLSTVDSANMDLDVLVSLRFAHQTEQAGSGARENNRQAQKSAADPTRAAKRQLVEQYKAILHDRDTVGISTGLDRSQRWRHAAPGGRDGILDGVTPGALAAGTAANAAVAARNRADMVCFFCHFS